MNIFLVLLLFYINSKMNFLFFFQIFNELKVIDLSFSEHLIIIPDITSVPNLEILILEGYTI